VSLPEPVKIALEVGRVFEELKIPYYLGGSLASSIYGIPRTTQDIDFIADLSRDHVTPLVKAFQNDFYLDEDMIRQAIFHTSSFNMIHLQAIFKVDVFIAKKKPFSQREMERRKKELIDKENNLFLFVATPEDILLEKLLWFEKGNRVSERQWRDVLGILKVQGNLLSREYLRAGAPLLGVEELLERVFREAE